MTIQKSVIKEGEHKDVSVSQDGGLFSNGDLGWLDTWIFTMTYLTVP